jgi:myosin heavy subunit
VDVVGPLKYIAEPILKHFQSEKEVLLAKYSTTIKKQQKQLTNTQSTSTELKQAESAMEKLEEQILSLKAQLEEKNAEVSKLKEQSVLSETKTKAETVQLKCQMDARMDAMTKENVVLKQKVKEQNSITSTQMYAARNKDNQIKELTQQLTQQKETIKQLTDTNLNQREKLDSGKERDNLIATLKRQLADMERVKTVQHRKMEKNIHDLKEESARLLIELEEEKMFRECVEEKAKNFDGLEKRFNGLKELYTKDLRKNVALEKEIREWIRLCSLADEEDKTKDLVVIARQMRIATTKSMGIIHGMAYETVDPNMLEQYSILFRTQTKINIFNVYLYLGHVAHQSKVQIKKLEAKVDYFRTQMRMLHDTSKALRVRLNAKKESKENRIIYGLEESSHEVPSIYSLITHIEGSRPTNDDFSDFIDEAVTRYTISPHTVTEHMYIGAQTFLSAVQIQRWTRRHMSQMKDSEKPFYMTFFNYKHHTVRYFANTVKKMVLDKLRLHTIVSGTPLRLSKLMVDCPAIVKNVDDFLNNTDPNSHRMKLKSFLQDSVEERMALFMGDYLKRFPETWHQRIVCGIFVEKGDIDHLNDFLLHWYHKDDMDTRNSIPLLLMTRWGLSEKQCCRLLHRYCAVQHILRSSTIRVSDDKKKVTMELKPTSFEKDMLIPMEYESFNREKNLESFD